jgi:hypothetical protein
MRTMLIRNTRIPSPGKSLEATAMVDEGIDLGSIVLQVPWNGGYGGFDAVSLEEFNKKLRRPPRDKPQLGYDPEMDALTIMAGVCTVYDDNGYYDGGWDIMPDTQRLAIPRSALVELVNGTARDITVPAEMIEQEGKCTFDWTPKPEQFDAIEQMKGVGETLYPRSYGDISCKFWYGTLRLTSVEREDGKMGIRVEEFTRNPEAADQRDTHFFSRPKP